MERALEQKSLNSFRRELIHRFFNPQSYFLYSFINELKSQEATLQNPSHVAVVGLVVDTIINAQDKVKEIKDLSQINGFSKFYSLLSEKIEFLRTAQLTTPQMMETVRGISAEMVKTLCHMVEDEEVYRQLTDRMGLELDTKSKVENTECEEETIVLDELLENHIDSSLETSGEQTEEKQPEQKHRDPGDFFYSDVHQKLKHIRNLLKSNRRKRNSKFLQRLQDDFQDLRDWSMIQGDEDIETISHKILYLLSLLQPHDVSKWNKISPVIQESVTLIYNFDSLKKEDQLSVTTRAVIERIEQLCEEVHRPSTGPEIAAIEIEASKPEELEPTVNSEPVLEERDKSLDQKDNIELRDTNIEQKQEENASVAQLAEIEVPLSEEKEEEKQRHVEAVSVSDTNETEPESLTLPGEGDLLEAIELWTDEELSPEAAENLNIEQIGENVLKNSPIDHQAFEKFMQELEVAPEVTSKFSEVQSSTSESNEQDGNGHYGSDLIEEAEMYFTFAKEALVKLKQDVGNKHACEDMELACYSLKILANKLGYELVGKVIGAMEGIMKKVLAEEVELKKSHAGMMADVLGRIEEMGKGNHFQSAKLHDWADKVISTLGQMFLSTSKENANQPLVDSAIPQERGEEDPLEFLMVDDPNKYLKQLLRD